MRSESGKLTDSCGACIFWHAGLSIALSRTAAAPAAAFRVSRPDGQRFATGNWAGILLFKLCIFNVASNGARDAP
jgi:hypothetical protein